MLRNFCWLQLSPRTSLISVEFGPVGYLLLVLLAGALFPWRRWRQQRCYLGAAAVVVAAGLAFRLTVLPPNLLTQRALEQAR